MNESYLLTLKKREVSVTLDRICHFATLNKLNTEDFEEWIATYLVDTSNNRDYPQAALEVRIDVTPRHPELNHEDSSTVVPALVDLLELSIYLMFNSPIIHQVDPNSDEMCGISEEGYYLVFYL